jgi:propanol-preferring alcohol dehydrogenase
LCEAAEFTGWTADGGFADYAVVPSAFAYRVPAALADAEAAPLLCAGIIGYRALKLSGVGPGGRLGVYGFGSSAHVTLQVARSRGIDVYVCTREASHRALAERLGAAWAGDIPDRMPRRMHGIIVFAPAGPLVPVALDNLDRGGTLALAGIHMTAIPSLDYERHLFYERIVRSVTANTRADGAELLDEAARIGLRPVVTTFPLEAANRALAALARGAFPGSGVLVTDNNRSTV